MFKFIDIHSHTLPGIDDGMESLKDTLKAYKYMAKLGFEHIICTPHQKEFSLNPALATIKNVFDVVEEENETSVKLHLGTENYLDSQFLRRLNTKQVPTLADSNYFLFELPFSNPVPNLENILFQMSLQGYKPVLAHIERYDWLDHKMLKKLSHSCLYQLNITSTIKQFVPKPFYKKARKYLDKDLVDIFATDMHSLHLIRKVEKSLKWVEKHFGKEYLKLRFYETPLKIIRAKQT
ncbi:MAG: hypothetical protein PF689_03155 [Deltaproteobacteria bacterium]|jgi:protein-tyrosine phosphatase|nr:hypothetical protein [Deltaproteobacteria bacterium]